MTGPDLNDFLKIPKGSVAVSVDFGHYDFGFTTVLDHTELFELMAAVIGKVNEQYDFTQPTSPEDADNRLKAIIVERFAYANRMRKLSKKKETELHFFTCGVAACLIMTRGVRAGTDLTGPLEELEAIMKKNGRAWLLVQSDGETWKTAITETHRHLLDMDSLKSPRH